MSSDEQRAGEEDYLGAPGTWMADCARQFGVVNLLIRKLRPERPYGQSPLIYAGDLEGGLLALHVDIWQGGSRTGRWTIGRYYSGREKFRQVGVTRLEWVPVETFSTIELYKELRAWARDQAAQRGH